MINFIFNTLSLFILHQLIHTSSSFWLSHEVASIIVNEFDREEEIRQHHPVRGVDRRESTPFISGNGFRGNCSHICDESNACRLYPEKIHNATCVFVKTDFFEFFVKDVVNRVSGSYKIISHNGDLSAPDGQNDAPSTRMPHYITSNILQQEYEKGRLIAHHGQNLWWVNKSTSPRPVFSHCLPIGIENRQYPIGKNVNVYSNALKQYVLHEPHPTLDYLNSLPLLLVAFYPKSRVPDRKNVLTKLFISQSQIDPNTQQPVGKWYNETDLDHTGWLSSIGKHKFVLAPFGHGLDTHRISEILLMGGIPVMRRSTISSCYDDSDNVYTEVNPRYGKTRIHTRGSLPVVILENWDYLTKARLESEWTRLSKVILTHPWDWKRLFLQQWLDRIGCEIPDITYT
jgi:hypothetical protein